MPNLRVEDMLVVAPTQKNFPDALYLFRMTRSTGNMPNGSGTFAFN
jgi:hypothetical protein